MSMQCLVQVLSLLSNPSLLEAGCTVKVTFFQHGPSVLLFPFPRQAYFVVPCMLLL